MTTFKIGQNVYITRRDGTKGLNGRITMIYDNGTCDIAYTWDGREYETFDVRLDRIVKS